MKNSRAQVTIFIIAGIAIVALIILFFLFRSEIIPEPETVLSSKTPEEYISRCVSLEINEISDTLIKNSGYIEIPSLTYAYNYEKIPYLCSTSMFYSRCFPANPVLMTHLKEEIEKELDSKIDQCFLDMEENFEKEGYEINIDSGKVFELEIFPNIIKVEISKNLETSKGDEIKKYNKFSIASPSLLFNFAELVQRIIEEESTYCNSEYLKMMQGDTWAQIEKIATGDGNKIYTITDKVSEKKWRFAIRSCVTPKLV